MFTLSIDVFPRYMGIKGSLPKFDNKILFIGNNKWLWQDSDVEFIKKHLESYPAHNNGWNFEKVLIIRYIYAII